MMATLAFNELSELIKTIGTKKHRNDSFIFTEKVNWDKVFKSGLSKICGRQPLKNFSLSTLEYFVQICQCKL